MAQWAWTKILIHELRCMINGRVGGADGRRQTAGAVADLVAESFGVGYHTAEHSAYLFIATSQFELSFFRQIATCVSKIKPDLSLGGFSVSIRQLANEHFGISLLAVALADIGGNATGRATNLIGE